MASLVLTLSKYWYIYIAFGVVLLLGVLHLILHFCFNIKNEAFINDEGEELDKDDKTLITKGTMMEKMV